MGGEAFYTTAAQVLPALLIAISVEASLISKEFIQESRKRHDVANQTLLPDFMPMVVLVSATFFVGETAALAALILRADGWRAWAFGPVTIATLLVLCAYAAVLPLARLRWTVRGFADGLAYVPRLPPDQRLTLRELAAVVHRYGAGEMRDAPRDEALAAIAEVTRDPVLLGIQAGTEAADPRGVAGRVAELLRDAGADMQVALDQELKTRRHHRRLGIRAASTAEQ
ncbi:hypothetical protein ACQP2F_36225 [Actinoplanes sp. CA-030573]|uniref:hypothetical protein n=1 Tax=Actinoplanes sp. CA-030573 TaxID=3239898 RepID=UPI003D8EEE91